MRKKVLNSAQIREYESRVLEYVRGEFLNDPWKAASTMTGPLLDHFPEARLFLQGQSLLHLLCLDSTHHYYKYLEEYFADYARDISLVARNKISRAFREYYVIRGEVFRKEDFSKRFFFLPETITNQDLLPKHIGLEIEIDDGSSDHNGLRDGLHEIRTYPTRDKHALKQFLSSMQDLLFIFENLRFIPLGYELSAHVNVDAGDDCLGKIKVNLSLQSFIMEICLPNISQARLERLIELENTGRLSISFRYGRDVYCADESYAYRMHVPLFEVSPILDLDYFIFVCEVLGKITDEPFLLYAYDKLKKVSNSYIQLGSSKGLPSDYENLLKLPWLQYHELMYGLRRDIISAFGE